MKLYIIFAQRHNNYEGEHAPEALEVADEYTFEENPYWINEKLEEYRKKKYWESVQIITIDVPSEEIYKRFENLPIKGSVLS